MIERAQDEPSTLEHILHRHANVNAITADWPAALKRELYHPKAHDRAHVFRRELARAILHSTISPDDYERLTRESFDTQEEVNARLREIWRGVFGSDPIREE